MIPDRCTFCKGTLHEGKTEFIARVGDEIIVIKEGPAFVCDRCGEMHYSPRISRPVSSTSQCEGEAALQHRMPRKKQTYRATPEHSPRPVA